MSDQSELRAEPIAFGGWLWLFSAFVGIDFLRKLLGTGTLYMATSKVLSSWESLPAFVKTVIAFDYLEVFGLLAFSFLLLHSLTFKQKRFPKLFNRYMLTAFVANLIEFALAASLNGFNGLMVSTAVFAAIFIGVFWAAGSEYLKKSERVKLTFVS